MKSRILTFAAAACLALSLGACSTEGLLSFGTNATSVAAAVTPISQSEVTAYADALLVSTIAHKTADFAALNWKTLGLAHDDLTNLNAVNEAIHSAMEDLRTAKKAGRSLSFTAFNAAVDGYRTFQTQHALSAVPVAQSEVPTY